MIVGGEANLAHCSYVESDYQPPTGGVVTITAAPSTSVGRIVPAALSRSAAIGARSQPGRGAGAWYLWKCTTDGVEDALFRPPVWIPHTQQPGETTPPSPASLAEIARRQLRLPPPRIAVNPTGDQLVNLPTWMWLSSGWEPMSATATAPGVSVTAIATPTAVTWSMGDGSTVTCTGAGTPHQEGADPLAPSPDCGHIYRRSSAHQPRQRYAVTAIVQWTVTWSGAGQGGRFPDLTTTGHTAFRVAESQALNSGG